MKKEGIDVALPDRLKEPRQILLHRRLGHTKCEAVIDAGAMTDPLPWRYFFGRF